MLMDIDTIIKKCADKEKDDLKDYKFESTKNNNSMDFWYPRIKELNIPQPETYRVPITPDNYLRCFSIEDGDDSTLQKVVKTVEKKIKKYPVFIRTDYTSGKFDWDKSCFVSNQKNLQRNVYGVLQFQENTMIGIPNAIYIRKYIPMESYFTGWYDNFPVNKEVRTFIKDGKIQCMHNYWPLKSIKESEPKDKDWENKFKILCDISKDKKIIENIVNEVCIVFPKGYWSVDCSKSKDGIWYLIDMATGQESFHAECKFRPKTDYYKDK